MSGDLERRIANVLARLELISHVSAVNPESSGEGKDTSEDIGGRRPPGGIMHGDDYARDENGDLEPYPQRSFAYFRQEFARARTVAARERVLGEAEEALEAARRAPADTGEPEMSSPRWKRWVAESSLSHGDIARKYGCHRSYVKQIRDQYRDRAA